MLDRVANKHLKVSHRGDVGSALPSARQTLGGREDLLPVYRAAKDLLFKRRVWILKQFEKVGRLNRLTICNTWRVDWDGKRPPRLYLYNYALQDWQVCRGAKAWGCPAFAIAPARLCKDDSFGYRLLQAAIEHALNAAGWDRLPDGHDFFWGDQRASAYLNVLEADRRKRKSQRELSHLWKMETRHGRRSVAAITPLQQLKGKDRAVVEAAMQRHGVEQPVKSKTWLVQLLERRLLRPAPGQQAADYRKLSRGLRNCFRESFVDQEVLSALVRLDGRSVQTTRYLTVAKSTGCAGLLRHARERPNAVPLLGLFKEAAWNRQDIFSRSLWLNRELKDDLAKLTNPEVTSLREFTGSPDAATHRWLLSVSLPVARALMWHRLPRPAALAELARAVQQAKADRKVPVVAVVHLARTLSEGWLGGEDGWLCGEGYWDTSKREGQFRLYLLFLRECADRWVQLGHKGLCRWLNVEGREQLNSCYDYLHNEGFDAGQPARSATWQSLRARSDTWHQNQRRAAAQTERPELTWSCPVGDTQVGAFMFKPLCTSQALIEETNEQEHCVWSYDSHCVTGRYQVFAVHGPAGERSTLGLIVDEAGAATVQQHYGKFNTAVSDQAWAAGCDLAEIFTQTSRTVANG